MHEAVFYAASVWMALLLLTSVYAVIRMPSTTGRILACLLYTSPSPRD